MPISVIYKGRQAQLDEGVTGYQALKALGGDADRAIAVKVNGEVRDLHRPLPAGSVTVEEIYPGTAEGREVLRHSAAHLMATAIRHLFPNSKFAHGPATEDGFFYDFYCDQKISEDVLPKIEEEMKRLIRQDVRFERFELPRAQALEWANREGGKYKVHFIEREPAGSVSFYRDGDFVDLCTGPHVPSTGWIRAIKLMKITGAYWLGDERNEMLTRIYGTAWESEEKLQEYLRLLEEAKKRDHRKLGTELDLFSIHPEVGAGLPHFHPKGALVRHLIDRVWYDLHLKNGYQLAVTPHIASEELYRISGHLQNYSDLMYGAMDIEGQAYRIKPMNCPGHIMIYKTRTRSYRELPLRLAEMGTVYRFEKGGVLHGLLRVRGFTIDDAHIFVAPNQVEDEVKRVFDLAVQFLRKFGFSDFVIKLSTRPAKAIGTAEQWANAEGALHHVLKKAGVAYEIEEGGGAFYGPKISIYIKDCLGRLWQCSTVQFDFNLPERFDVTYVGEDNQPHRPYIVHRALMGSVERFFGVLVEHYAGAFPLWLSPVQVMVLPVTDGQLEYAQRVRDELRSKGFRVEIDASNERISHKIREAQLQKVPYMAVVGQKEEAAGTVAVRDRARGDLGPMALGAFVAKLIEEQEANG